MAKYRTLAIYDYSGHKICDLYDSKVQLEGEAYGITAKTDINGLHTLTFSLPYMINISMISDLEAARYGIDKYGEGVFGRFKDEDHMDKNFRWELLKNEYLIRYTNGNKTEWYVATKPTKSKSNKNITGTVTCEGTESQLKTRNIYLTFDDTNGIDTIEGLMTKILKGTGWTLGHCDTIYETGSETEEKVRSLISDGKMGALSLIHTVCNLFKCRPVFRTEDNEVDIYAMSNRHQILEGEVGKTLTTLSATYDSSDIVTRLYVEGEYGEYGYVGIDDVNPTGLNYLLNFDYYREIGVFTAEHEAALNTYITRITDIKRRISENAVIRTQYDGELASMLGQARVVVYYVATGFNTPKFEYGTMTDEQKRLKAGDEVIILKTDGTYRTATITNTPTSLIETGDYAMAKFVVKASGVIGGREVLVESKEKTIKQYERKINATAGNDNKVYISETVPTNPTVGDLWLDISGDPYLIKKYDGTGWVDATSTRQQKIIGYYQEIERLREEIAEVYTGSEDEGAVTVGLYQLMNDVMKADGTMYQQEHYQEIEDQLMEVQDNIEADFIAAMGYLLRDGYWSDQNYTVGQEQFLYNDALDMSAQMARPKASYRVAIQRLTEDFGVPMEDIECNAILRLYDEQLKIEENTYIKSVSVGVDEENKGTIEISNEDIVMTGLNLSSLVSRMAQLADLIEQRNTVYNRAKAIGKDGSLYTDRLNGAINVMQTQILSTVSNWYTDSQGNMVFEAADGSGAMMLSGAGFMLASGHTEDGSWDWRTKLYPLVLAAEMRKNNKTDRIAGKP